MNRPYIIAEVGSNWHSYADCIDSISAAKDCRADAVKFQYYSHKSLYGFDGTLAREMPKDWIELLADKASKLNIDFLCTAFDVESLLFINEFVPMHKIASSNFTHIEMIKAAKETGKPVIISCGGQKVSEIRSIVSMMREHEFVLCYCVSAYPASNLNLFNIEKISPLLQKQPNARLGFSCHSSDIYGAVSAYHHFGVDLIEKHFKLNDKITGPDAGHSLNPKRFKRMVELIEDPRSEALPTPDEFDMVTNHNCRLIALRDISPDEEFVYGSNFGLYRSKISDHIYLSGLHLKDVSGKKAKANVLKGFPIHITDVK